MEPSWRFTHNYHMEAPSGFWRSLGVFVPLGEVLETALDGKVVANITQTSSSRFDETKHVRKHLQFLCENIFNTVCHCVQILSNFFLVARFICILQTCLFHHQPYSPPHGAVACLTWLDPVLSASDFSEHCDFDCCNA